MRTRLIRSLAFIVLLGLIVLGSVLMVRGLSERPLIHEPRGFQNCRIASSASILNLEFWDQLVRPDRLVHANIYHLLLGGFTNNCDFAVIVQVLLGILLAVGFWLLLLKLGASNELALFSTVILELSPAFVYGFTNPLEVGLGLVGLVFGTLFFVMSLNASKGLMALSIICFIISMSSGPWYLFASLIILWGETIANKCKPYFGIIASLIAGLIFYLLGYAQVLTPKLIPLSSVVNSLVFEMGGMGGLSASCLILGITGILVSWAAHNRLITSYILFFSSLIGVFFFSDMGFILMLALSAFAGFILLRTINRPWVSQTLKYVTLGLAFFSLAFSGVISVIGQATTSPDQPELMMMNYLRELPSVETVLSAPEYGAAIQTISGKPVVLDTISDQGPSMNETFTLFHTRNLERAKTLLNKYSVGYIMITPKMKSGSIWNEEDQGLLFLLRNNETFKKLDEASGVEVWQVLR